MYIHTRYIRWICQTERPIKNVLVTAVYWVYSFAFPWYTHQWNQWRVIDFPARLGIIFPSQVVNKFRCNYLSTMIYSWASQRTRLYLCNCEIQEAVREPESGESIKITRVDRLLVTINSRNDNVVLMILIVQARVMRRALLTLQRWHHVGVMSWFAT